MPDRLRDQYLHRLHEKNLQASPAALILCDLIDFRLGLNETAAGDANQTASKAFNGMEQLKKDMHKLKTRGEDA